jgi:8-oxo-dGTP pyrophosphatase MutT (NUDIX family)
VEPFLQVIRTSTNATHSYNQLNYIKAILSCTLNIEEKKRSKTAAVMILLTIINEKLNILFTHRTNNVSTHKDQVSFPGGHKESHDVDLMQTAIRETEEEVGILIAKKEILGKLPEQNSISGFKIQPYVCFIENLPKITLNQNEVKHIFTIPMDWVLNKKNWNYQIYKSAKEKERKVVVFNKYKNEIIWGITGQVLVCFADLLQM